MSNVFQVADYRKMACKKLPHFLFEYIDGGSYDERTLRDNVADLRRITLRQRVLRDVSTIDTSTELPGEQLSTPVVLAPVGLAGMYARRGEVQAAIAAEQQGVPFCLSTLSICAMQELHASLRRPFWYQLYMIRDRAVTHELLATARSAGCSTLVFTVDLPFPGARYRDYRSGLSGAPGLLGQLRRMGQVMRRPHWAFDVGVRGRPHTFGNLLPYLGKNSRLDDFVDWISENFDPTVTWKDLEQIRQLWDGKLVVKGILDVNDAKAALDAGADGIVVSNHGGRQLDSVMSTARALPRIADEVRDRMTVLVDGGVRSGLDVVKMLGLGAHAVMLGRAWVFALAARGGIGVGDMLKQIQDEMRVAMALTGTVDTAQIGRDLIVEPNYASIGVAGSGAES